MFHDYESMGAASVAVDKAPLLEAWTGTQIVGWYGSIERQIDGMLDQQEAKKNYDYANKLREFLKIWRGNELTGSINRETIETLRAATQVLAVDEWNLKDYFSGLRDSLRTLLAAEEELPRGQEMGGDPMGGGGGPGGPPMDPEFGPEDTAPGGMGGEEELGMEEESGPGGTEVEEFERNAVR